MKPIRLLLVGIVLFAGMITTAKAAPSASSTFIVGVLPIHSARVLAERYEPLRTHLESHLKQPVRIESAFDFRGFHLRSVRGDFDLSITPAHFARLLQTEAGGQPLVQFSPDHDSLLLYSAGQPLNSFADLKGKKLAVIDQLAITVMAALHFLHTQGLEANLDYTVVQHRTHASAAYSLINGMSAAIISTSQGMRQIPEEVRRQLIVKKHIANIPAFILMARADMPKSQVEQLKRALLAFPNEAAGIDFLAKTGYKNLIPINEAAMKRIDPYLDATIKALK